MLRKSWLIIIALAGLLPVFAQDDISIVSRLIKPVRIDGINNEWKLPFNLYDSHSGLMFAMACDSNNLYLCFTGNDEMKIKKMMRAGWEIELASKEKTNKFKSSISFPSVTGSEIDPAGSSQSKWHAHNDFTKLVNTYKLQPLNIKTLGFRTRNGTYPWMNADGVRIGMAADSVQGVVYEMSIPVKELFDPALFRGGEVITITVTVNSMDDISSGDKSGKRAFRREGDAESANSEDDRGMNNSSTGRAGGSGMTGLDPMGRSGNPGGAFPEETESRNSGSPARGILYERVSFKQKFKLAKY